MIFESDYNSNVFIFYTRVKTDGPYSSFGVANDPFIYKSKSIDEAWKKGLKIARRKCRTGRTVIEAGCKMYRLGFDTKPELVKDVDYLKLNSRERL